MQKLLSVNYNSNIVNCKITEFKVGMALRAVRSDTALSEKSPYLR